MTRRSSNRRRQQPKRPSPKHERRSSRGAGHQRGLVCAGVSQWRSRSGAAGLAAWAGRAAGQYSHGARTGARVGLSQVPFVAAGTRRVAGRLLALRRSRAHSIPPRLQYPIAAMRWICPSCTWRWLAKHRCWYLATAICSPLRPSLIGPVLAPSYRWMCFVKPTATKGRRGPEIAHDGRFTECPFWAFKHPKWAFQKTKPSQRRAPAARHTPCA